MRVSEIFHSIQGEGELAGVPSAFVRTAGCNRSCVWCDTPDSRRADGGTEMTVAAVFDAVAALPTRFCVLTGGEPMIATGIRELAAALVDAGRHVTMETAATVAPGNIPCSLASLSPKLSHATADGAAARQQRLQPAVIRAWIDHCPYQLKFVVRDEGDLTEVGELLDQLDRPVPLEKVLLMPEGTDRETLRRRAAFVVAACRSRGFRYCPRLQIELFGNRKGT